MNRRIVLALFALALACSPVFGQAGIKPESAERPFAPSGHIWMDLSAGDYTIRAGRDDRVRVEWITNDPDDVGRYKATIEPKGRDLLIATTGPKGSMRVTVELPSQSDLTVKLSAGDLTVEGIKGNKDISSWAGDVKVDVGRADEYRQVDASVTAGDLSARPFDVRKSGLFRSFSWKGRGSWTLKVRLTAGNVTLR